MVAGMLVTPASTASSATCCPASTIFGRKVVFRMKMVAMNTAKAT